MRNTKFWAGWNIGEKSRHRIDLLRDSPVYKFTFRRLFQLSPIPIFTSLYRFTHFAKKSFVILRLVSVKALTQPTMKLFAKNLYFMKWVTEKFDGITMRKRKFLGGGVWFSILGENFRHGIN